MVLRHQPRGPSKVDEPAPGAHGGDVQERWIPMLQRDLYQFFQRKHPSLFVLSWLGFYTSEQISKGEREDEGMIGWIHLIQISGRDTKV